MSTFRRNVLGLVLLVMSASLYGAVYQDVNGLVVIEAENLTGATGSWLKETSFAPFTGASYVRWNGADNFSTPGVGVIGTSIKINTPGTYRIQFRNKVGHGTSATEANDTWMKFPGVTAFYGEKDGAKVYPKGSGLTPNPEGASKDGWLKVYSNGTTAWTWRTNTNDNDLHFIYVEFATAGEYNFSLSGRSQHHCVDRVVLYKSTVAESYATDLTRKETLAEAATPELYTYDALEDFSNLTSGEAPFYKDNNFKALAIDPKLYQDKIAKAVTSFTGKTGTYTITLKTKAEKDGESTYNIYIGDTKVGTYKNPEVDEAGDMTIQTYTIKGVSVAKNTNFTVEASAHTNGEIAEDGAPQGTAWSRGRWTEISFVEETVVSAVSRIAVLADGNSPDPDDIGGTAVTLAILRAMGAESRLVYYSHSCDLVRNNTKISADMEVQRQTMMQTSCDGTADKWGGFDHITFYNCRTQQALATTKLTDAINASTAMSPLAIIEAGEPDVIYDAIAAAESAKLQYVSIITHHPANDDSADYPNKNLSNILADFTAVTEDRITDQNVNLQVPIANWDWAKNHSDERITWLYAQGKIAEEDGVVAFQDGKFDCSDAGMVYYHLTGEKLPTVAMLQTLFTTYVGDEEVPVVDGLSDKISLHISFEDEAIASWETDGADYGVIPAIVEGVNVRSGSKVLALDYITKTSGHHVQNMVDKIAVPDQHYLHMIAYTATTDIANGLCMPTVQLGDWKPTPSFTTHAAVNAFERKVTSRQNAKGDSLNCAPRLRSKANGACVVYYDDIVLYTDQNETADLTAPELAKDFVVKVPTASGVEMNWIEGVDSITGVNGTLILRTSNATAVAPKMMPQAAYGASGDNTSVSMVGDWTVIALLPSGTTTYTDNTTSTGITYTYAVVHKDLAYNYSTPLISGDEPSAISEKLGSVFKCFGVTGAIELSDLKQGNAVSIYTISGAKVFAANANSSSICVPVEQGIYLVECDGEVMKVMVK